MPRRVVRGDWWLFNMCFTSTKIPLDLPATLPEPPMVRERLIQEIRFLADHLRGKTERWELPAQLMEYVCNVIPIISSTIGSYCRDRNRELLEYALGNADQHGMWIYVSGVCICTLALSHMCLY